MVKNFLKDNILFYTVNKVLKISEIKFLDGFLITVGFISVSLMEALSIGSVYPVIHSIINDDVPSQLNFIKEFFKDQDLVVLSLGFFCFLFFFKNIIILCYSWFSGKVIYKAQKNLINNIFEMYLFQDYKFHVNRNKSEIIRDINLGKTLCRTLDLVLTVSTELLTVVFLFYIISLTISAEVFLTILAFVILIFLAFNYLRKRLKLWGKQSTRLLSKLIQNMNESFSGIKEIKVYNKESFFSKRFFENNNFFTNIAFKKSVTDKFPKAVMETGIIFGITFLLYFLFIITDQTINQTLPLLGMLFLVIIRIMPAIIKIIQSINYASYIKFQTERLATAHDKYIDFKNDKKLQLREKEKYKEYDNFDSINLKNVNFNYQNSKDLLNFKNMNLDIKKNEFIGIVGESGSGKTTLMHLILGLVEPDSGEIIVNGKNNVDLYRSFNIAFVFQTIFLLDDTLSKNICFGIKKDEQDKKKLFEVIEMVKLSSLISSKPEKEDFIIGEDGSFLSQGQKQRVGIARALYRDPEILVLDEPTSSLDEKTEKKIIDIINQLKGKKTIFLISHKRENLKNCDKIISIKDKKIEILSNYVNQF
jgi:ATP-binding cassette, subfamily B, bacterial PglK